MMVNRHRSRQVSTWPRLRAAALALCVLALPQGLRSQVFNPHALRVEGEIKEVASADLDGDGRKEMIVSSTRYGEGAPKRTLHICGWGEAGGGPGIVVQDAWQVPPEAVFWDTGPAGQDRKGHHLNFVSLDGLTEVVRRRGPGFATELRIEAPVLLSFGQEEEFRWLDFVQDWNGDGRPEVMLPLGREVRFYRWGDTEGWLPADSVPLRPLAYYSNNIVFGRDLGGYGYLSVMLYPVLVAADLNGDGRRDLLALRDGKGFCYLRSADGRLDAEPLLWDLEIRTPEERARKRATLTYRVADLNRDGCADVAVHKVAMGFTAWDSETALFLGRPGGARPGKADRRFPSRGLLSGVSLEDLDGDGYEDVTVWSVKMGILPIVEILLRRIIHVRSHTYYAAWPKGFLEEASNEGDFALHLDSDRPELIRGLVPATKGDLNGDGIKDLVAGKGEGRLAVYLGLPDRRFDSRPWVVLDAPGVNYVVTEDLNGDGLCDLYGYQVEKGSSRLCVWLQVSAGRP
jgi:hypothetical protein